LRIGIACAGTRLLPWQLKCVQELMAVPGVAIAVILEVPEPRPEGRTPALYRWWLGRASRSGPLVAQDASAMLAKHPRMTLAGTNLQELLWKHPMDVLLQLSGADLSLAEAGAIPFGIWRFMHCGRGSTSNPIPGVWEILKDEPMTSASLQASSTAPERCGVLREGFFKTLGHSVLKTAETVLDRSALWPAQVCRAILSGDHAVAAGTAGAHIAAEGDTPSNSVVLQLLWKEFSNARDHQRSKTESEEWNIGVLPHPVRSLLDESPNLNVRWLPPPAIGQSRATPFGWMREENLNVLYEKSQQETGESVIARLRPKRDNNLKRSRTVLEAAGHLSYPFIQEKDGQVHAIPEQVQSGKVDLYLLDEEGTNLTFVRTLLEQALCSPTLFQYEGRWWLFGTDASLPDTVLLAFYADHFEGPYTPHLLNPIKMDIRSARPGGTPFEQDGGLCRPARDGSTPSGGITFNRIITLTPERFAEETVKHMDPVPGRWSHGIHTLSAVGEITLVDGMRKLTDKSQREKDRKKKHNAS
ncbi:MAG: hypothetical protein ABIY71_00295, partial [Flavobacteriales bacterium]